jgi:hypothetical protein
MLKIRVKSVIFQYFQKLRLKSYSSYLVIVFSVELALGICHYVLRKIHPSSNIMQIEINFFAIYALGILSGHESN